MGASMHVGLSAAPKSRPPVHAALLCRVTEAIRNDEQQVEQAERKHREALQVRWLHPSWRRARSAEGWASFLPRAGHDSALA